jgi:hypothetical protein
MVSWCLIAYILKLNPFVTGLWFLPVLTFGFVIQSDVEFVKSSIELVISLLPSLFFLFMQCIKYCNAILTISVGMYGSLFYMLTELYSFHSAMGIVSLSMNNIRFLIFYKLKSLRLKNLILYLSTLPIVESNRLPSFSSINQPSSFSPYSPQSSDYGSDSDFGDGIQALSIYTPPAIGSSIPIPGSTIASFSTYDLIHSSNVSNVSNVSYVALEENNPDVMSLFFQARRDLELLRPAINPPFSSSLDGNSFPLDTRFHSLSSDSGEEFSGSEHSEHSEHSELSPEEVVDLVSELFGQLRVTRSANSHHSSHHNPSDWHSLKDEDYLLGRTWRYLAEF